jgi:hypothetical protein
MGAAVRWVWNWLNGEPDKSVDATWRVFNWSVIGLGALTWLMLTVMIIRAPSGHSNESAAIANLRTINTAEVTYLSGGDRRYGTISDLVRAGLLDSRFDNVVSGYVFEVTLSGDAYLATAMPASTETGKYGFTSGTDAVVRYANLTTATCLPCFPKGMSGKQVP